MAYKKGTILSNYRKRNGLDEDEQTSHTSTSGYKQGTILSNYRKRYTIDDEIEERVNKSTQQLIDNSGKSNTGHSSVLDKLQQAARRSADDSMAWANRYVPLNQAMANTKVQSLLEDYYKAMPSTASIRQRYDFYDKLYGEAADKLRTQGMRGSVMAAAGDDNLERLKAQRDKWGEYLKQAETEGKADVQSDAQSDWMYYLANYDKTQQQGKQSLTQSYLAKTPNYTRNQLVDMRDRATAQGNDTMTGIYDEMLKVKADEGKQSIINAIRGRDDYKTYNKDYKTIAHNSLVKTPEAAELAAGGMVYKSDDGLVIDAATGMTNTELKMYAYLLEHGDEVGISADDYAQMLEAERNSRAMDDTLDFAEEFAHEQPVLSSMMQVPMSVIGGTAYVGALIDKAAGNDISQNKPYMAVNRASDKILETVGNDAYEAAGGGFGGEAARFLYSTGMSIADFVANYFATGGGSSVLSEAVSLALMGTNAAASTLNDSLERGATQGEAIANATAAGIAEVLFEKLSVENFSSIRSALSSSSGIKKVLMQAGIEASEEMCTEVANMVADGAIMGDLSEYKQMVEQYRQQGMTLREAEQAANEQMALRVGVSGLGGLLSGAAIGSAAVAMSKAEQSKLGKYVYNNDAALTKTMEYAAYYADKKNGTFAETIANAKSVDDYRAQAKGHKAELGKMFAQMVYDSYMTDVATGRISPNETLGKNPTADDIIKMSTKAFRAAKKSGKNASNVDYTDSQSTGNNANALPERRMLLTEGEQSAPSTAQDRLAMAAQTAAMTDNAPAQAPKTTLAQAADMAAQQESAPAPKTLAQAAVATAQTQTEAAARQTEEQLSTTRGILRTQLNGAVPDSVAEVATGAYDGSVGFNDYIGGVFRISNAATRGASLYSIQTYANVAAIPTQTQQTIYDLALADAQSKVQTTPKQTQTAKTVQTQAQTSEVSAPKAAAVETQTAKAEQTIQSGKGGVVFAEGAQPTTKQEQAAAKALDIACKAVGITVNVVGDDNIDIVLSDGTVRKGAASGMYDRKTNTITTERASLVTVMHESVHYIANNVDANTWRAFHTAVTEAAQEAGMDLDEQTTMLKEAYSGTDISERDLQEEQVAYIVGQLADKPDLAEHFADRFIHDEESKSLFKRIIDKIRELLGKIRDKLTRSKYYKASEAVASSIEALDKIEGAYFDALQSTMGGEIVSPGVAVSEQDGMTTARLYSVKYLLTDKQRAKAAKDISKRIGEDVDTVKSWLDAETSVASLILNPKYSEFLDYEADDTQEAIKKNSDYPQGTIDFSNIYPKRRDLTNIMGTVMRQFKDTVFSSDDIAKIIGILKASGLKTPCSVCYVEDRRQKDYKIAQNFLDSLELYRKGSETRPDGKPFNENQLKALTLIKDDSYTPDIYELATLEGRNSLKAKDAKMEEAWIKFNNARGMASARLLTNEAEYKHQILKYNKRTVASKNSRGGLRAYSFSDAEMYHIIDMMQIIMDASSKGLYIQGYNKVNEFVMAFKDTGMRILRSLIPAGDKGYHLENGEIVLDFDNKEGIDTTSKYFFDATNERYVGNNVIGINDTQIRAAMRSDMIDQIIPFHTGQSAEVLARKGIDGYDNYKEWESEKDIATGTKSDHQVNFYTEVLEAAEKEGKPIKNKREFVEKFLSVCKENGLIPRFANFLNVDAKGNFVYTEGYEKFLVDFKLFNHDAEGTIIPLEAVKPVFNVPLIKQMLIDYTDAKKAEDAEFAKIAPKVFEKIKSDVIDKKNSGKVFELKDESEQLTPYELEYKINGIRKEISELDNESMFASEIKQRSINNKIYKLEEDLSKLVEIERKATKRTPLNVVLDNLSKYRYTDLESIAEQLTDNAWDYDEDISRSELEDGIRQIIEDRATEMSPVEMQAPKYGVWVRPISDLTQSNSTHFELKDVSEADYKKLVKTNTKLEQQVSDLKKELKRTYGMAVADKTVRKIAKDILSEYSSNYDAETFYQNLRTTYDFLAKKDKEGKFGLEKLDEVLPQLKAMASDIIEQSSVLNTELEEFYAPIRKMVRETRITPTQTQKDNIADYADFLRSNMGKLRIVKEGGTSVLTLYENLVKADPSYFDADVPEEDMLPMIADYINEVAAPRYDNPYGKYNDEAIDGLAYSMLSNYLIAEKMNTFADKKYKEKQDALKKQGERLKAKIEKVRNETKANELDKYKRAKAKTKLRRNANRLKKWLAKPQKNAYVPQRLVKNTLAVIEFVDSELANVNYYDAIIAKAEARIKEITDPAKKMKQAQYLATLKARGNNAQEKLNTLLSNYQSIKDDLAKDGYDVTVEDNIIKAINEAKEFCGNSSIRSMSLEQINALNTVLELVTDDIVKERKIFANGKAQEATTLAKRINNNLSKVERKGDIAVAAKTLNGDRFLRRLGGFAKDNPFDDVADMWIEGTRRQIKTEQELTGLFNHLVTDKDENGNKTGNRKKFAEFEDRKNLVKLNVNGEDIELTHAELVNLYGMLNDPDNRQHVIYGGVTHDPKLTKLKKALAKNARLRRLPRANIDIGMRNAVLANTEMSGYEKKLILDEMDAPINEQIDELMKTIWDSMSAYDKDWYYTIRDMFDNVSPALLDEQNMAVYGFKKATKENYWRIETDKNFVRSEDAWSTMKYDASPANMGFMKNRVNGKNPVVLRSVVDLVNDYIKMTSTYVGMLSPSIATKRVLSIQAPDNAWSVREALSVYGPTAINTINQLMEDNIGMSLRNDSEFSRLIRSGMAQSALTLNPSVAVGQAASFFPAMPYIPMRNMVKGLLSGTDEAIIKKYSPLYWTRTKGFALAQYVDMGKGKRSDFEQRARGLFGWITGMDLFTVRKLWAATEAKVRKEQPRLQIGTKQQIENGESPFYIEVARQYENMLIRTQPMYTSQQRTGLARSRSEILRAFSMFRTVRDQNFGEIYEAVYRLARYQRDAKTGAGGTTKEDVKRARIHLAKAITGQILAALMLVALKEIAKLLLDHNADDFKDDYGELDFGKLTGTYFANVGESLMSNVFFGSDVFSLIKSLIDGSTYYGMELNISSVVNDFSTNLRNLFDEPNGKDVYNFAGSLSQIAGVPLRNALKIAKGIAESINDISIGLGGSYASEFDYKTMTMTTAGITPARLYKAIKDGDEDKAAKYREVLMEQKKADGSSKYTTAEIDRAVAKVLGLDDDRIAEAYNAKTNGDTTTFQQLKDEIVADGFSADMVNAALSAYESSLELEDDEEVVEEDKTLSTSTYAASELADAVMNGNSTAITDITNTMKQEGKTGDNINNALKGELQDRYREVYTTQGSKEAKAYAKEILSKAGSYDITQNSINRWSAKIEVENGDVAAANRYISMITDASEKGYLKNSLSTYYKTALERAYNTGDTTLAKELERQMGNINLYDSKTGERYFSRTKISDWKKSWN